MPRKARIDVPGTLHHIISRGIEKRKIFEDDADRDNFLKRLGNILKETSTPWHSWALIPNHFHLLLGCQRIGDERNQRRQPDGIGSTGCEPGGKARRKIDPGFECDANNIRNAFFHVRPY